MRAARTDANHAEIVAALRKLGCSVQSLATVGQGCPDLLVGFRHQNFLLEVKDGQKSPSRRVLTADECEWHKNWRGSVQTVLDVPGAIAAVSDG